MAPGFAQSCPVLRDARPCPVPGAAPHRSDSADGSTHPLCLSKGGSFLFSFKKIYKIKINPCTERYLTANRSRSGFPQTHPPFPWGREEGKGEVEGREQEGHRPLQGPPLARGLGGGGLPSPPRTGWDRGGEGVSRNPPTQTLTPYQYKSLTRALLQMIMTSQSCCRSRKHASHSHRSILHPRKVT